MKKLLVLILAMLFVGVGIASASSTLKMSGDYYVKGTYYDNRAGTAIADPVASYGQYDHEMTLDMVFAMTPYTKVAAKLELRDEIWGVATTEDGGWSEGNTGLNPQGNIYVEELYGQHTFMNHHTLIVGLVKTSTWASDFDNNKTEAYRVNYVFKTPLGPAFIYTEKYQTDSPLRGETLGIDADSDAYVTALYTKIGSVNVLPLFAYIDAEGSVPGLAGSALDFTILKFDLGFNGTINNIGFEAELIYTDYSYDTETPGFATVNGDYGMWGAYLNAWTQMDALKIGAFVAYGSYEEDVNKGFSFGSEFDGGSDSLMPGRAMLLGDEVAFVTANISSATMLAIYGTYNITEKASLSLFGAYVDSNVDLTGNMWDGATAYEVNVIGEYKITPLLKYAAGAALAQVEYGSGVTDPKKAIEISHKLSFTF